MNHFDINALLVFRFNILSSLLLNGLNNIRFRLNLGSLIYIICIWHLLWYIILIVDFLLNYSIGGIKAPWLLLSPCSFVSMYYPCVTHH